MPYYTQKRTAYKKKKLTNWGASATTSTATRYPSSRSGNSRFHTSARSHQTTVASGHQTKSSGSIALSIRALEQQRTRPSVLGNSSQPSTEDSRFIQPESQSPSMTHPKMVWQSALMQPTPPTQHTLSQEQYVRTQLQPPMQSRASSQTPVNNVRQ